MTMNARLTKTGAVLVLLTFFAVAGAHAAVPRLVSFQGNLTDNSGNRLTGTYDFKFELYDAENGGTKEWEEQHLGVLVANGLYLVQLGANSTLDRAFNKDYWLKISVKASVSGAYEELSPRQRLTSTPYSFRSEYANSAYGLASGNYVNDVKVSSAIVAHGLARNTYNLTASTFTFYTITVSSRISPANDLTIGTSGRKVSFPGNVDVDGTLTYVSTLCFSLGGYVNLGTPASTSTYDSDDESRGLGFVWVDFGNLNVTQMILEVYYYKPNGSPHYTWQLWDETESASLGTYSDTFNSGIRTASITVSGGSIPATPRKLRVRFQSTATNNGPIYYGSCLRVFTR